MMSAHPFVSVIVATFDRPQALSQCLESLTRVRYPRDRFEIVVVDDGSAVDLATACTAASASVDVRLVRQANGGVAAARNRGAATARGDVLLFTDDDCQVSPEWMEILVDAIRANPEALVGGLTLNVHADNPFACASQLLVNEACCPRADRRPRFVNGNNLAVSRAAFEAAGGFDETFRTSAGEDRELSARFQDLGRPLVLRMDAIVGHASPLTWARFLKQHTNYGRAAFRLRVHPSRRISPVRFGNARFYLGLLAMPVNVPSPRDAAAVRALLLVAQAATAAGFIAEWLHPRIIASHVSGGLKIG